MTARDHRPTRSGPDGISWPEPGSGFEADQYSPAGEIDRLGAFAQAARTPGVVRRAVRFNIVTKVMALFLALLVAAMVVLAIATIGALV